MSGNEALAFLSTKKATSPLASPNGPLTINIPPKRASTKKSSTTASCLALIRDGRKEQTSTSYRLRYCSILSPVTLAQYSINNPLLSVGAFAQKGCSG